MREPLTAPPRLGAAHHGPPRGQQPQPRLRKTSAERLPPQEIPAGRPPRAMERAAKKGNRRRAWPRWLKPTLEAMGGLMLLGVVGTGLFWTWKAGVVGSFTGELRSRFIDRTANAGFALGEVFLEGRTATDKETVLKALGASRGDPLLPFDIKAAQARLKALPWVLDARVERRLPDALYVWLTERQPMAIWQHSGKFTVIDAEGRELGDATALAAHGDRTLDRLPQVVGDGANEQARNLLDVLSHVPIIERRVSAATWIGKRRWNLTMDNQVVIRLPEEGMERALHQLAQVELGEGVLNRDIAMVDLRHPDRMTVRTTEPPPAPETVAAKKPPKKT